ncbi:MAG: hypothetical protein K5924_02780 [Chloroflexi bacterium]|nr:hypothetical protein [Chloroflexota bacterium]
MTDPPQGETMAALPATRRAWVNAAWLEDVLPVAIAASVIGGFALVLALTPIGSGDFGQWLMTSRHFSGDTVPAYRELTAVPPVVPALLAAIRSVIPDPVAALHVISMLLLVGLGASLYVLGTVASGSRWIGTLSVAIGLLLTDRFTELFAFGGLLQAGALALGTLSVAAFIRATNASSTDRRMWWVGVVSLALAALTHVGTSTILVPIGAAAAVVALLARGPRRLRTTAHELEAPLVVLAVIGVYWLLFLRGASGGFVDNPASLAYRGPDRLLELLFSRWPTALVVIVGGTAIVLGAVRSLVRRRGDGYLVLAAWAFAAWSVFGIATLAGSATDYPRFATPMLLPLVVGSAAACLWLVRALAGYLVELGLRSAARTTVPIVVLGAVLVATPLAIQRHDTQAAFYELRDRSSLASAAAWLDDHLVEGQAVLADTRDAKWIEGLTGRAALFSQSVRYAFRPMEWQRSADADALLRSTDTLTSGFIAAQFTDSLRLGSETVPSGLIVEANHGGEMLSMLRLAPTATSLIAGESSTTTAELSPVRVTRQSLETQARVVTVWAATGADAVDYTQAVTAWRDGTSLEIEQRAPGHRMASVFSVAPGRSVSSVEIDGIDRSAIVCFAVVGASEPCLRISASQTDARLSEAPGGGIRVATATSDQLDVLITALTAGEAAVGLQLIHPPDVADRYQVGGAVLYASDPAYAARLRRLEAIGFRETRTFGAYRVLTRSPGGGP